MQSHAVLQNASKTPGNLLLSKLTPQIHEIVQRNLPSIEQLFDHRVHLGHKSGVRHADARQFLFGTRPMDMHRDLGRNWDILDLNQTRLLMSDALLFVAHVVAK